MLLERSDGSLPAFLAHPVPPRATDVVGRHRRAQRLVPRPSGRRRSHVERNVLIYKSRCGIAEKHEIEKGENVVSIENERVIGRERNDSWYRARCLPFAVAAVGDSGEDDGGR